MGKAPRANSKAAALKKPQPAPVEPSAPLFEVDTTGSSSVRHSLLHAFSSHPVGSTAPSSKLRKGTSITKPLRSDLILAARSAVPPVSGRVVAPSQTKEKKDRERRKHVDRETKERLKRIVGRDGEGEGLWGIRTGVGATADEVARKGESVGTYDAWEVQVKETKEDDDEGLKRVLLASTTVHVPKPPATLHSHPLLSTAAPRAIPLPHPGTSYNPTHPAHQALLSTALTHYTAVEAREERGQVQKDAADAVLAQSRRMEEWEMYEAEVGSGESSDDEDEDTAGDAAVGPKKPTKRRTRKQRTKALEQKEEAVRLARRRALKARAAGVLRAPEIHGTLDARNASSLAEKAAHLRARKARLQTLGLTRFRSGPNKVPDQGVTFQLGEELADNLRTLAPEGNLWREWVGSGMRRGKVASERAYENKKGGKRGGRGKDKGSKTREVAKYSWKFGAY